MIPKSGHRFSDKIMRRHMKSWRGLETWFAAQLDERSPRAALSAIALFALAGVLFLTGLKAAQDVFIDAAEAYAWGQSFLGGYGRHPPMTGWIAGVWYSVFPAADWASYALSRVMTFVTLAALYFIARRVAGPRRALFVVLVMMLYPLFHTKGERFNNYQVLLALLPLLVLTFLIAYEKRNALWGALLGLAAAACTLTIYSGLIGVAAIGLAALIHPDRMRFLRSPAPWVAAIVYALALTPHIVWLVKWNYPTLQWASSLAAERGSVLRTLEYLGHHFALLAIPVAVGAALLWPWRRAVNAFARREPDAFLVLVISTVLVFTPPAAALVMGSYLRLDWGNPLFFLVPLTLLVLIPRLVTCRAVARAGIVATVFTLILLDRRADLSVGELPPASGRRRACAVSRDRRGADQGVARALQHAAADRGQRLRGRRLCGVLQPGPSEDVRGLRPGALVLDRLSERTEAQRFHRRVRDLRGGLSREAGRTRSEGREAGNFGHAPDRRREGRHDDLRIADFGALP